MRKFKFEYILTIIVLILILFAFISVEYGLTPAHRKEKAWKSQIRAWHTRFEKSFK